MHIHIHIQIHSYTYHLIAQGSLRGKGVQTQKKKFIYAIQEHVCIYHSLVSTTPSQKCTVVSSCCLTLDLLYFTRNLCYNQPFYLTIPLLFVQHLRLYLEFCLSFFTVQRAQQIAVHCLASSKSTLYSYDNYFTHNLVIPRGYEAGVLRSTRYSK